MLPDSDGGEGSGRYGSYAMELLLNRNVQAAPGVNPCRPRFWRCARSRASHHECGERNTQFVMDYLATERIRWCPQDVLDIHPAKFASSRLTGKALVKRLALHRKRWRSKGAAAIRLRWRKSTAGGSIDLF